MLDNTYFYGNFEDEKNPITVKCTVCGDLIEVDQEYLNIDDMKICKCCVSFNMEVLSYESI